MGIGLATVRTNATSSLSFVIDPIPPSAVAPLSYYPAIQEERLLAASQSLPYVVGVEVPRDLGINVDNVEVSFLAVPDNRLVVYACAVGLHIDSQRPVDLELQAERAIRDQ